MDDNNHTNTQDRSYSRYEKQRLHQLLTELKDGNRGLNWSAMARAILLWSQGDDFDRKYFYRLSEGALNDGNVELIISWVEETLSLIHI